jgi:hypothetical protein
MILPLHRDWRGTLAMFLLFGAAAPFAMAGNLHFTPNHADGRYMPGQTVGWTVSLAPGMIAPGGSYSYTVIRDNKVQVTTGSFILAPRRAMIAFIPDQPGAFRVVVDYLAPPPPPPPSPAQMQQINAGVRTLLIATDPTLKVVLDKYPDYEFVHGPRFDFKALLEDRVATLHAMVAGKP